MMPIARLIFNGKIVLPQKHNNKKSRNSTRLNFFAVKN